MQIKGNGEGIVFIPLKTGSGINVLAQMLSMKTSDFDLKVV
jgi:hypothetical protein